MRYGIALMVVLVAGPALADSWKDESGKGRWSGYDRRYDRSYNYGREYKEEFYRGRCKIERKWERDGDYEEKIKCKGYR